MTGLETIAGDLRASCKFVPGTFLSIDELLLERLRDSSLHNLGFYAADGVGYFPRDDGGMDLVVTRGDGNLVLRHLCNLERSSFWQLTQHANFYPVDSEAQDVRNLPDTVVIDMTQLRMPNANAESTHLWLCTKDGFVMLKDGYSEPNLEEQKLIHRLGYSSSVLSMLHENGVSSISIEICSKRYVSQMLFHQKHILNFSHFRSLWRSVSLCYLSPNLVLYGHRVGGDSSCNLGLRMVDVSRSLLGKLSPCVEN